MAIEFTDVYNQAIGLFNDPSISNAYSTSPISFFQIMYAYLENAIPRFNNPMKMQGILANKNMPVGQTEVFDGDGTAIYTLSTTPVANSFFEYIINGIIIDGTYDQTTNKVTFAQIIPSGEKGTCQWYFPGEFLNVFDDTAINILARLLVLVWAEREKNFLLDIRRLLNDTDFHMGNEANSMRAKSGWYETMRAETNKQINKYAWNLQYQKQSKVSDYWNV
jgi:hypothetical protein